MNTYLNNKKAVSIGNKFWDKSEAYGLINIVAENLGNGQLHSDSGHEFLNMSSYSYLGLDSHPAIIEGAIRGIRQAKTLNSSISRIRVRLNLIKEAEDNLSQLFGAEAITVATCSAAAEAILPLIAAGIFTDNTAPLMIFDKHAHFCMNIIKPICADEAEVVTSPHNDLNFIEDACKKNPNVVYVADSVYSTGGAAPIKELLALQDRYGLFLFFDDAHSTSVCGKKGRGYVLEHMGDLNERTIIISSLNKGFGASGGLILLGAGQYRKIVNRFGGPFSWSQRINTAGLGAIIASCAIHDSDELVTLQSKLKKNIDYFDSLIQTAESGDGLPIRLVPINNEEQTVEIAKQIFDDGFYTSPLFFPIVGRGRAGLRVMLRSDLKQSQIKCFHESLSRAIIAV